MNVARDSRWQTKRGDGGAIREKLSLSAFPGSRFGKGGKLLGQLLQALLFSGSFVTEGEETLDARP